MAEGGEVGVGVIGAAGQGGGGDHQKAFAAGEGGVVGELFRGGEAVDGGVLDRGLEVLTEGEEVDVRDAEVVHDLADLGAGLAEADHEAGFGEDGGVEAFDLVEQAEGLEVAGAGSDGGIEAGDCLQVVVEHVGAGGDHDLRRAGLAEEVGGQDFDRRVGRGLAEGDNGRGDVLGAAVGEVIAVDAGDDDVAEAEFGYGVLQRGWVHQRRAGWAGRCGRCRRRRRGCRCRP